MLNLRTICFRFIRLLLSRGQKALPNMETGWLRAGSVVQDSVAAAGQRQQQLVAASQQLAGSAANINNQAKEQIKHTQHPQPPKQG